MSVMLGAIIVAKSWHIGVSEKIWNHQLGQPDYPCFVRNLFLQSFAPAGFRMNDRFSRRAMAQKFTQLQQFSRCERGQRVN
jgi:hypothetical protein